MNEPVTLNNLILKSIITGTVIKLRNGPEKFSYRSVPWSVTGL